MVGERKLCRDRRALVAAVAGQAHGVFNVGLCHRGHSRELQGDKKQENRLSQHQSVLKPEVALVLEFGGTPALVPAVTRQAHRVLYVSLRHRRDSRQLQSDQKQEEVSFQHGKCPFALLPDRLVRIRHGKRIAASSRNGLSGQTFSEFGTSRPQVLYAT